jgi:hypothetical protein
MMYANVMCANAMNDELLKICIMIDSICYLTNAKELNEKF